MSTGARLGRPPLLDLKGEVFGKLTVEGRDPSDTRFWLCKCECGSLVRARTEQLRWQNKRSCGCSRYTSRRLRTFGNFIISRIVREAAGPELVETLGHSARRSCCCCGTSPAAYVVPVFGILDPRFRQIKEAKDPRLLQTLCVMCYSRARAERYLSYGDCGPHTWVTLSDIVEAQDKRGLDAMKELFYEYHTPEDLTSSLNMRILAEAKALNEARRGIVGSVS